MKPNGNNHVKINSAVFVGPGHPYRGGLSSFNEMLVRLLARRGADSRLYTFTVQYPSFLFPGKSQFTDSPPPEDVRIERLVNTMNPFNWIRIGRRIKKEKPDVLMIRYWLPLMAPCFGTICRLARRNKHTKVLVLLDNVVPHEHRPFDRLFTKYFIGSADGFIYMSDQVKTDLDTFTTTKPALFSPHPLFDVYGEKTSRKEACEALGLDPDYKYALFFGYVRDYKGLDWLLEAWAELKKQGKVADKRLIVAGEYYGNKEKYTEQIRRNGLERDVLIFDEFIPDDRVRYYFSVSDLVIQPYKTATQSGVTQVAYHFEVPMIVTDVGGLSEIVPDGRVGYVVKPEPKAIASAVAAFYEDGRAEEFCENLKIEKNRFSWEAMVDRFEELYARVAWPDKGE